METPAAPVNRSAGTGLTLAAIAVVVAALALPAGGAIRQLLWLAAIAAAGLGAALGFVGFTVARAGAPRLVLSLVSMVANGAIVLALLAAAVTS
jgi:hypothetical protein